jgi:hypothetical protein
MQAKSVEKTMTHFGTQTIGDVATQITEQQVASKVAEQAAELAAKHAIALAEQAAEQAAGFAALRGFERLANIDVARIPGGLVSPVTDPLFKKLFSFNMDVVCNMTRPGIVTDISAEQRDYIILNTVRMAHVTVEAVHKLIEGGLA